MSENSNIMSKNNIITENSNIMFGNNNIFPNMNIIAHMYEEYVFLEIDKLNNDDRYDITIISEYLDILEYIYFNIFNDIDKRDKICKWYNIFISYGYPINCYVIEWIFDMLYRTINK